MKFHSGPIDNRALHDLSPPELLNRIQKVLMALDLEFVTTSDRFKLSVMKARVMNGDDKQSNLTLRSSPKSKQNLGSLSSIVQKFHYIRVFGLQYNRGYDGTPFRHVMNTSRPDSDCSVKFNVMIHRVKNLDGLYIIDLKRLHGDLWEFKRIYNAVIEALMDLEGK